LLPVSSSCVPIGQFVNNSIVSVQFSYVALYALLLNNQSVARFF